MRKFDNIVTTVVFAVCILGISVATVLSPDRSFSKNENRTLATAPKFTVKSLIKGEFASDYEKYLSDQFVLRDEWIAVKTISEIAFMKKDINGVYLGKDNYLLEMHKENDLLEPIDWEKAHLNADRMTDFIKAQSALLGEGHVKAMIVPTATNILSDKLPMFATSFDQTAYISYIKDRIPDNFIDVNETLSNHKDEYIFYRTDHHWTMHGAYLSYVEWANAVGLTPYSEEDFNITKVPDFKGTVYSKINFAFKTDTMELYEPDFEMSYKVFYEDTGTESDSLFEKKHLQSKDKYQVYLDGNHSVTRIETGNRNGKTLLVVKDSYANSYMTLAANHYETVYMIDLRYFRSSLKGFVKEKNVSDILVLYNAITFAKDGYTALFEK